MTIALAAAADPFTYWKRIDCLDVDADGHRDVYAADTLASVFQWHRNTGPSFDGSLWTPYNVSAVDGIDWSISHQWGITADYVLGGPRPDFVFGTSGAFSVVSAPGPVLGADAWSVSVVLDAAVVPSVLAVGDMNGDGLVDVVAGVGTPTELSESQLFCYFQALAAGGARTFTPGVVIADPGAPTFDLVLADRDNDGDLDIALSTMAWQSRQGDYQVVGFFNLGAGVMGVPVTLRAGQGALFYCASVRVDGPDIVTAFNDPSASLVRISAAPPSVTPLGPVSRVVASNVLASAAPIVMADLSMDSIGDLVILTKLRKLVFLQGLGSSRYGPEIVISTQALSAVVLVDTNADNTLDIVCGTRANPADIISFETGLANSWKRREQLVPGLLGAGQTIVALRTAELSGDTLPDLLFVAADSDSASGVVFWAPNNGNGSFASARAVTGVLPAAVAVLAGDFDEVPGVDIVVAANASLIHLYSIAVGGPWLRGATAPLGWQVLAVDQSPSEVFVLHDSGPAPCAGLLTFTPASGGFNGTIAHRPANGAYAASESCMWAWAGYPGGAALELAVQFLDTEGCCDFVTVDDGAFSAPFSGFGLIPPLPPAVVNNLTAATATVSWASDFNIDGAGFVIAWRVKPAASPPSLSPPPPSNASNTIIAQRLRISRGTGTFLVASPTFVSPIATQDPMTGLLPVTRRSNGASELLAFRPSTTVAYVNRSAPEWGLETDAAVVAAVMFDADGDGDDDLTVVDQVGLAVARGVDSLWAQYPQRSTAVIPTCGLTMQCIAETLLRRTSSCVPDEVLLPAGVYRGCFGLAQLGIAGKAVVLRPQVPGSSVVFDCEGRGVLFRVSDGGALELRNITIRNAVTLPDSIRGGSPMVVTGAGSMLRLLNVTVANCTTVLATGLQTGPLQSVGGALMVLDGGTLEVHGCAFIGNTALDSGGAVSAQGAASRVRITSSVFARNVAVGGSGGAVQIATASGALPSTYIAASRFEGNTATADGGALVLADTDGLSTVTLYGCVFAGNRAVVGRGGDAALLLGSSGAVSLDMHRSTGAAAGFAGGSLFLAVGPSSKLALANVTVVAASAGMWGGGLAVVPSGYVLSSTTTPPRLVPHVRAGGVLPPVLALLDVSLSDTRAAYGGGAFLCGLSLNVSSAVAAGRNAVTTAFARASSAGGALFACNGFPLNDLSAVLGATNSSAGTYGRRLASPLATLEIGAGLPARVATGVAFGAGSVVGRDDLAQVVIDGLTFLTVAIRADLAARADVLGGAPRPIDAKAVSLSAVAVTVLSFADHSLYNQTVGVVVSAADSALDPLPTVALSAMMTVCPRRYGRISGLDDPVRCAACESGATTDAAGLAACVPIKPCPDNALRVVVNGSDDVNGDCVCLRGAYAVGDLCPSCPVGASCAGGAAAPQARAGYFPNPRDPSAFLACRRPESCVGAPRICAESTTGFLCAVCKPNYYTSGTGVCTKCPPGGGGTVGLVLVPLALAALAAYFVFSAVSQRRAADSLPVSERRARQSPRSPAMVFTFVQIVGIVATANLNWPSSSSRTLNVFALINLDSRSAASECALGSFWVQYVFSLLVPVFVAAVTVATVFVLSSRAAGRCFRSATGKEAEPMRQRVAVLERLYVSLSSLAFIPLAKATLMFFDCTAFPDGSYRLKADLSEHCFSSKWWGLLPLGLAALVVYVVTPPGYALWRLLSVRGALADPLISFRLGGLYQHLRRRWFFAEILHIAKRLAIVATALFTSETPLILVSILCGLFVGFGFFQARVLPYYVAKHNKLEFVLNAAVSAIVFLGFVSYASKDTSSGGRAAITSALILVLIGGLLYGFAVIGMEIRGFVRAKAAGLTTYTLGGFDPHVIRTLNEARAEALAELGADGMRSHTIERFGTELGASGLWGDASRGRDGSIGGALPIIQPLGTAASASAAGVGGPGSAAVRRRPSFDPSAAASAAAEVGIELQPVGPTTPFVSSVARNLSSLASLYGSVGRADMASRYLQQAESLGFAAQARRPSEGRR